MIVIITTKLFIVVRWCVYNRCCEDRVDLCSNVSGIDRVFDKAMYDSSLPLGDHAGLPSH